MLRGTGRRERAGGAKIATVFPAVSFSMSKLFGPKASTPTLDLDEFLQIASWRSIAHFQHVALLILLSVDECVQSVPRKMKNGWTPGIPNVPAICTVAVTRSRHTSRSARFDIGDQTN